MTTDNTMQASIEVDLDDKAVKEGSQRVTRTVTQMGRTVERQSTRAGRAISRSFQSANRSLSRFNNNLVKVGGALVGGSIVRSVTNWRDELSSLGRDLNATDSEAEQLNQTLRNQAMQYGINTSRLSAYAREMARLSRSTEATTESLIEGSQAIAAWGLEADGASKLASIYQHYGAETSGERESINDMITSMASQKGAHSEADSVNALYQMMQGDFFSRDQEGFKYLLALWQAQGGQTAGDNTSQLSSYLNDMKSESTRSFNKQRYGSDFIKQVEIDGVQRNVLDSPETWINAHNSTMGGRTRKGLFLDQEETLSDKRYSQESAKAIMALSRADLDSLLDVKTGATTTLADATGRDFNATMNRLSNAFMKFADANLAEPLTDLADFINNLNSSELEHYLEILDVGIKSLAAVFIGQKILDNPRISAATATVVLGQYVIGKVADHYNEKLDQSVKSGLSNVDAYNRLIMDEGLRPGGYQVADRVLKRVGNTEFESDEQRNQVLLNLTRKQVSQPYMDRFIEEGGIFNARMTSIKKGAAKNDWYGADKDSSYGEWFLGGVEQGEKFGFSDDAIRELIPQVRESVAKEKEITAILKRLENQQQKAEVNINITTDEGLKATVSGTVSDGLKPNIKTGNQRKNAGEVF